jgi:PiT family inorganic phosphate transporter
VSPALVILSTVAIAAANGANDNFKGVAALLCGGNASWRSASLWANLTTLAGALVAVATGARLAAAFSGGGLLPHGVVASPNLLASVALGAAATVGLAVRLRMPVSTTHALLGALLGGSAVAYAGQLHMVVLVQRFVIPLLVSPLLAFLLAATAYPVIRGVRLRMGVTAGTCVCLTADSLALPSQPGAGLAAMAAPALHRCERRAGERVLGVDAQAVVRAAHFFTAGLQSFARGLNDTPKIAALLLAAGAIGHAGPMAFVLVAFAMLGGGLIWGRRVGETMSQGICRLDTGQSLVAGSVTGVLVLAASLFALPVSMTHVAVGSLAGLGSSTGQARWSTLRSIALAWGVTLPLAAALGATVFAITERIAG